MTRTQCPSCTGSGRVVSHLNPHDPYKVGAGMGMHRCGRCAGQGFIHTGSGAAGSSASSLGENLRERFGNLVILFFAFFFGLVFANAQPFGLNWFVSGIIGLILGSAIGGFLLATRVGRYILLALGLGFVVAVVIAVILKN